MALAVAHVLIAIFVLDLFRHYVFGLKKFPRYLIVIGGIAGLAPDLDIPLGMIISFITGKTVELHRVFTHSFFFVLLFAAIGVLLHYKKITLWRNMSYVVAAGWFLHIFLDCFYGGDLSHSFFFWPLSNPPTFCPSWNLYTYGNHIDAIILVMWLIHEEVHKKVRDYF